MRKLMLVVGAFLAWTFVRRARRSANEAAASPESASREPARAPGLSFEQTAPPAEDDRIGALRQRIAAGGRLSDEEQRFLRAEGVDIDPDRDPMAEERGGKLGRGFWDEDAGRDLA